MCSSDLRVAAVLDDLERNPRLALPYTWKWRTNVAALHLLLAFALHRVATSVVIAEAREMIDTIDVHALGLGDGDARVHIGQLSNALRRDCRFLSAILMHTGRMTVDQSREMFVNECYQDEGNARQQAARGTYDPAYLNYTMGKLMIRRLREDWTATRGGQIGRAHV